MDLTPFRTTLQAQSSSQHGIQQAVQPSGPFATFLLEKAMGNSIKCFGNIPENNTSSLPSSLSHHLTADWSGRISTGEPPNYRVLCGGTGGDRLHGPPGNEARLTGLCSSPDLHLKLFK